MKSAKAGHIYPDNTHDGNDKDPDTSSNVYERMNYLEKENEQMRSDMEKQKEVIALLQKAITPVHQGGLYKSNTTKPLKEAVEKALKLLGQ